ncbi:hypothetical protein D3C84_1308650 [compost metagenome]
MLMVIRFGWLGLREIVGIARETADQQRHVIDQFCHCPQAQCLTVARRFIGDRHASEQR